MYLCSAGKKKKKEKRDSYSKSKEPTNRHTLQFQGLVIEWLRRLISTLELNSNRIDRPVSERTGNPLWSMYAGVCTLCTYILEDSDLRIRSIRSVSVPLYARAGCGGNVTSAWRTANRDCDHSRIIFFINETFFFFFHGRPRKGTEYGLQTSRDHRSLLRIIHKNMGRTPSPP